MARAYNIHVVTNIDGSLLGAFTVKHELLRWLKAAKIAHPMLKVNTIHDGIRDWREWDRFEKIVKQQEEKEIPASS